MQLHLSNSLVQRPWSDPWLFSHTSAYLSKQSQFYLEDTSKMKITSYLYYFNPVSSNNHSPCFPPESPIICSQHSTQNNLLKLKILPLTFNSPMTSHLLLLFSHSLMSDSLRPHGLQPNRLPCPALSPGVCSNSLSIESVMTSNHLILCAPFSSCPQSFPASGSFPVSWFFASGGQNIGASASASVLPMNIQGWFPLGLTDLISLLSKGLSRVFSSTKIWKHQFFGA